MSDRSARRPFDLDAYEQRVRQDSAAGSLKVSYAGLGSTTLTFIGTFANSHIRYSFDSDFGNPVLWARRFFAEIAKIAGDTGAKHLIGEHADLVCEVEMAGEAAITDIDTPEALAAWRAKAPA